MHETGKLQLIRPKDLEMKVNLLAPNKGEKNRSNQIDLLWEIEAKNVRQHEGNNVSHVATCSKQPPGFRGALGVVVVGAAQLQSNQASSRHAGGVDLRLHPWRAVVFGRRIRTDPSGVGFPEGSPGRPSFQ